MRDTGCEMRGPKSLIPMRRGFLALREDNRVRLITIARMLFVLHPAPLLFWSNRYRLPPQHSGCGCQHEKLFDDEVPLPKQFHNPAAFHPYSEVFLAATI